MKTEEKSFQLLLENCQGLSILDMGGKIIPPARNGEWKHSGKWFCAFLRWHHEAQISDFWRGCRFVIVSGSRRVLSLWLFYMQASVSWTWCELQPGASARRQREVWHVIFWARWRPIVLPDQWDMIQTSEEESQWYPVMRGWTGEWFHETPHLPALRGESETLMMHSA